MTRHYQVLALAAGALAVSVGSSVVAAQQQATQQQAQPALFYDISTDPNVMELLDLSDAGDRNGKQMMPAAIVTRTPRMMLNNLWEIDCARKRMRIVHVALYREGLPFVEKDVTSELISTDTNPSNKIFTRLACTHKGDLLQEHLCNRNLFEIAAQFWGGSAR